MEPGCRAALALAPGSYTINTQPGAKEWQLIIGKVEKVSKGLSDLEYCRVLEREVPTTLRFLEGNGVKLLHYGPPVAMGVEHEVTPEGGGKAIVEALANSVEKTGR